VCHTPTPPHTHPTLPSSCYPAAWHALIHDVTLRVYPAQRLALPSIIYSPLRCSPFTHAGSPAVCARYLLCCSGGPFDGGSARWRCTLRRSVTLASLPTRKSLYRYGGYSTCAFHPSRTTRPFARGGSWTNAWITCDRPSTPHLPSRFKLPPPPTIARCLVYEPLGRAAWRPRDGSAFHNRRFIGKYYELVVSGSCWPFAPRHHCSPTRWLYNLF